MSDDDTYEIPLQDQRVFGAGLKRKRVKFVPSTSSSVASSRTKTPAKSIGDLYLNLVLPMESPSAESSARASPSPGSPSGASSETIMSLTSRKSEPQLCDICDLPLSSFDNTASIVAESPLNDTEDLKQPLPAKPRPHEASLAHQVCLTHSHPPSHLDRNRKGLKYLSAYGWDPDARLGLGADGQGIQFPIKPKPKDDKLGIGVVLPKESERRRKEKPEKLDAGKVRKMYEKDRRKGEKLRDLFYRNDDVERYLGGG
jgi:hypothetical protein